MLNNKNWEKMWIKLRDGLQVAYCVDEHGNLVELKGFSMDNAYSSYAFSASLSRSIHIPCLFETANDALESAVQYANEKKAELNAKSAALDCYLKRIEQQIDLLSLKSDRELHKSTCPQPN